MASNRKMPVRARGWNALEWEWGMRVERSEGASSGGMRRGHTRRSSPVSRTCSSGRRRGAQCLRAAGALPSPDGSSRVPNRYPPRPPTRQAHRGRRVTRASQKKRPPSPTGRSRTTCSTFAPGSSLARTRLLHPEQGYGRQLGGGASGDGPEMELHRTARYMATLDAMHPTHYQTGAREKLYGKTTDMHITPMH